MLLTALEEPATALYVDEAMKIISNALDEAVILVTLHFVMKNIVKSCNHDDRKGGLMLT